jgi:hypothetical protein
LRVTAVHVLQISGSLLPSPQAAAGMKTGNHDQGVIFDNENNEY